MKLRVVIADDEPLCRQRLRQFLRADPKIELVAECVDGREALKAIREQSPDLVFLDVKMPGLDGFGVLRGLNGTRLPAVVFVTAHERFAVRAFEAHAVDYLLKPFDRERFQMALKRVRDRLRHSTAAHENSFAELLANLSAEARSLERLTVKSGDRIKLVEVADIDWVSSADNYVEMHVGDARHLLRMTLAALVSQLPRNRFAQISRSLLVNLTRIKEMRPKSHGDCFVVLHDGTRLLGTRNYRRNLAKLLGKAP